MYTRRIRKHAAVLQRQVARRTEGRAGRDKVTLESVKGGRLSKVRTDSRAIGLKRSIYAVVASASDQKTSWVPKALGKHHWSQQSAAAHSFSHRQILGRWAKISAKIATNKQIYAPTLYLEDITVSFKARTIRNIPDISIIELQTILPKYSGYFNNNISRHIWNISGKWWMDTIPGPLSRNIFREIGFKKK